jgi:hypothetical protein
MKVRCIGGYYVRHLFYQKLYILPTQSVCVFCIVLRENNDSFPDCRNQLFFIISTDHHKVDTGFLKNI